MRLLSTVVVLGLTCVMGSGCSKRKRPQGQPAAATGGARAPQPEAPVQRDTAMLLLMEGARIWVGDADYMQATPDGDQPRPGALAPAKQAATVLASAVKSGVVSVHFYAAQDREVIGFGAPAEAVKALDAVKQADFANERNRAFMSGLDNALAALERQPQPRKLLVILGDGVEGAGEKDKLDGLIERAHKAGIEIFALQYGDSDDPMDDHIVMKTLGSAPGVFKTTRNAQSLVDFAHELESRM